MEIIKNVIPVHRPYWFVDAKWICGLLFIVCLVVTLLLATAIQLTDENRAPKIAALTIGSLVIRSDSLDIEAAKKELKKQGGVLHPIPNMPEVTLTEKDLALSTAELKLKIFEPLTKSIYQNGIDGAADLYAKTAEQKKKFKNDASLLGVFTKGTHEALKERLAIFVIVSIILLLGVIYFSAGWGRLANPGLLLFVVSLPGSFAALLISHPPKDGDGGAFGFLPPDIAASLGAPIGQVYYWVTILGLVLLISALLGKVISKIVTKKHSAKSKK